MTLGDEEIADLNWWIQNIDTHPKPIIMPDYTCTMYSDASLSGYGIAFGKETTEGLWTASEKVLHINDLELLAVKIGIMCFCENKRNEHVHIFSDNSVVVACINKMGSCKPHLNNLVRDIWLFLHGKKCLFDCISHTWCGEQTSR